MNTRRPQQKLVAAALGALLGIGCAALLLGSRPGGAFAAAGQAKAAPQKTLPRIGEFSIDGKHVQLTGENSRPNFYDVDLSGQPVVVKSARYDMTAPRITLSLSRGIVRTGHASGGVDVVVRNPERQDETTLHCTQANYEAAATTPGASSAKSLAGRLHLVGPVHSVLRDPAMATPLVSDAGAGDVEFLANGASRVVLSDFSGSGTPIEPAPAASKKKAIPQ